MSEVNFVVDQAALDIVQNTAITANFAECKEALADMIGPYKQMVVTEDGIADAKADRAKIRKLATRIDDTRKAVKKAYSEPLSAFEANCKELVAICEEGSNNLDRQIKDFEGREAAEKIERLYQAYIDVASAEVQSYLPWERLASPKWANKGYAEVTAILEIKESVAKTAEDLETIRGMAGDDTPYLLDIYKQTHDMGAVVRKASELATMRKSEAERRRKEDERRNAAEAESRMTADTEEAPDQPQEAEANFLKERKRRYTVTFCVTCTADQLADLGSFMVDNGIEYRRVMPL